MLSAVFASLRPFLGMRENLAGMNPDAAFFGFGLLLIGLFNLVFFPKYYRNTNKIGIPFLIASLIYAGGMIVTEAACIAGGLESAPGYVGIIVLVAGAAAYAGLTWAAYRISCRHFQSMNLNS